MCKPARRQADRMQVVPLHSPVDLVNLVVTSGLVVELAVQRWVDPSLRLPGLVRPDRVAPVKFRQVQRHAERPAAST